LGGKCKFSYIPEYFSGWDRNMNSEKLKKYSRLLKMKLYSKKILNGIK